jgi:hypothetical protein
MLAARVSLTKLGATVDDRPYARRSFGFGR